MCESKLKLQVVLIVLCIALEGFHAVDDCKLSLSKFFENENVWKLENVSHIEIERHINSKDPYKNAINDALLFTVTRAPRYFGILQDHRGQPLSVEVSEEYMDQDYIATNRKRLRIAWNKNPLDMEDFDDDDTEEILDEKDKDVKLPNKFNLQAGPV